MDFCVLPSGTYRLINLKTPACLLGQEGDLAQIDLAISDGRIVAAVPPDDTSIKSTPSILKRRANSTVSSGFQPSSTQSVAETRTNSGNSCGHTPRTASVTCSTRRMRFSKEPPYWSRRWLLKGERN